MNTRERFKPAIIAASFAMTIFLTACGGGDSGDPAPASPTPNQPAGTVAPSSLAGRSYDLQEAGGGASAVTFNSTTQYTFQDDTGLVESGSFIANSSGNAWTVTLQGTGAPKVFTLSFANETTGSYTRQRQGDPVRSGTFTARNTPVSNGGSNGDGTTNGATTNGGTTGTPSDTTGTPDNTTGTPGTTTGAPTPTTGTPDNTTVGSGSTTDGSGSTTGVTPSGAYNGFAPVSIAGRTMEGTRTFTSTGPSGQTHIYTFNTGTFHDSDPPEESGGNYTYTAGNSTATLDLQYNTPAVFVGDRHQLTLTFTAKDSGNFQSTYTRGDGTTIVINGTFFFQPIP
jgi:hypothetical protein